jgi:hypothetical protein
MCSAWVDKCPHKGILKKNSQSRLASAFDLHDSNASILSNPWTNLFDELIAYDHTHSCLHDDSARIIMKWSICIEKNWTAFLKTILCSLALIMICICMSVILKDEYFITIDEYNRVQSVVSRIDQLDASSVLHTLSSPRRSRTLATETIGYASSKMLTI